jgi:small subunit ribosomal protein S20
LANSKQSAKRARVSERRRVRNRVFRVSTRTFVRRAETAIRTDSDTVQDELKQAIAQLDRAANKGIIHKNNAARRKSRLMAKYNKANAASA